MDEYELMVQEAKIRVECMEDLKEQGEIVQLARNNEFYFFKTWNGQDISTYKAGSKALENLEILNKEISTIEIKNKGTIYRYIFKMKYKGKITIEETFCLHALTPDYDDTEIKILTLFLDERTSDNSIQGGFTWLF